MDSINSVPGGIYHQQESKYYIDESAKADNVPMPVPDDIRRCILFNNQVSGTYSGPKILPIFGRILELRVDIDSKLNIAMPNKTPVMNKISGDFYQHRYLVVKVDGQYVLKPTKRYLESWIVDDPNVEWSRCQVTVTGKVRFWKGTHAETSMVLTIPWSYGAIGDANITFTESGGSTSNFTCKKISNCFRNLSLEVDVCNSVNSEPLLPRYDTFSHTIRPADLPHRMITIENAYSDAGVCVNIRDARTIIDDSAPAFMEWTDSELHDAMESHFDGFSAMTWPQWSMWGLLANGKYDPQPGVVGIMFDYWNARAPPERQGFAIFRQSSVFNNLISGASSGDAQAAAMRYFLYCYVHEAGHAFNLVHSWNKGRPDALSWMNYPHEYDYRNGPNSFWSNFMMRFDDEELIHIRHGDMAAVAMGGDPWASGGHLEVPPLIMSSPEIKSPLELLVRSKGFFDIMEPVIVELRLRNLGDMSIPINARLSPEFGNISIYINKPDGHVVSFDPITCKIALPEILSLSPSGCGLDGEDRFSENIFLSYGSKGFFFDQPGEYLIRAEYHNGVEALSNIHKIRIGSPLSRGEDELAYQFFSYPVGMSLALHGSMSPYLREGMDLLMHVAQEQADTALGARAASIISPSIAKPFFRIQNKAITLAHPPKPEDALKLTAPAAQFYSDQKGVQAKALNISYRNLVINRSKWLQDIGRKDEAKKEVSSLISELADRGVHDVVLSQIKEYEKSI